MSVDPNNIQRGQRPIRVLHCPTATGGNPPRLAQAERELGLDSHSIAFLQTYQAYNVDEMLVKLEESPLWLEIRRWNVLWRALKNFDVVHFNFGRTITPKPITRAYVKNHRFPRALAHVYNLYATLLNMHDLPLLRRAGKGIVVTFQGSDARQADYCLKHHAISHIHLMPDHFPPSSDRYKRRVLARFGRYADRIYSLNPDLLPVLPPGAEFMPYAIDLENWNISPTTQTLSERLTIVHAPTNRTIKGTQFVLNAVQRLREEDRLDFKLVLVEGMSIEEARKLYLRADLVVDQLLVGWYGGLATELMALGKPVIAYLREEDLEYIPPAMRSELPIINASPATIYEVLKEWLTTRRHELPELGLRSRAYVEKWHDSRKIAARLKADYEEIVRTLRARTGQG